MHAALLTGTYVCMHVCACVRVISVSIVKSTTFTASSVRLLCTLIETAHPADALQCACVYFTDAGRWMHAMTQSTASL
jgi:hypothetical protein